MDAIGKLVGFPALVGAMMVAIEKLVDFLVLVRPSEE